MSGDTTSVVPSKSVAGSWYVKLLPPPVVRLRAGVRCLRAFLSLRVGRVEKRQSQAQM